MASAIVVVVGDLLCFQDMNACERDNDAVTITLSKAAEYSQAKGAVYTHLLCLLCKGSVSDTFNKSLSVPHMFISSIC